MNYQHKKWTALICATAIWFSLNATHSIQGAQIVPQLGSSTESASSVIDKSLDKNVLPKDTSFLSELDWGSIASVVVSVGAVLVGYNLLTARKQGWGWTLLCTVGVVIGVIGKIGASLFCEISSDATGISDWDSD